MGICIDYKGSLNDLSQLDEALREVRAFCRQAKWKFKSHTEEYSGVLLCSQEEAEGDEESPPDPEPWPEMPEGERPMGIRARVSKHNPPPFIEEKCRGIIVYPGDTEPLRLIFNSKGRMINYMELPEKFIINALPDTAHYIAFPLWVKTSGAPSQHARLCMLLRILKQKFMRNMKVKDPTGYYRTGNVEKLISEHTLMSALLGMFESPEAVRALVNMSGVPVDEKTKITRLDPNLAAPKKRPARKPKPVN